MQVFENCSIIVSKLQKQGCRAHECSVYRNACAQTLYKVTIASWPDMHKTVLLFKDLCEQCIICLKKEKKKEKKKEHRCHANTPSQLWPVPDETITCMKNTLKAVCLSAEQAYNTELHAGEGKKPQI